MEVNAQPGKKYCALIFNKILNCNRAAVPPDYNLIFYYLFISDNRVFLWYARRVSGLNASFFETLYGQFKAPIAELDCGQKCAPYNVLGAPFCCDTRHAIPTAYQAEWDYLRKNTNLWHTYESDHQAETQRLRGETPPGQTLIECLGHQHCQRDFRSLTCRAFPFFPYLTSQGEFIGLSYYWEYEDRCWVISNLQIVTHKYRGEFISAFDALFEHLPQERETYLHHSAEMRRIFRQRRRAIPLLHRNRYTYKISPHNERTRRVSVNYWPKFGPYKIAAALPFPDETR
jgi:hypothetical protein